MNVFNDNEDGDGPPLKIKLVFLCSCVVLLVTMNVC